MEAAFERALFRIHPRLREHPGLRYTAILNGQKKPEGKRWTTDANYAYGDAVLAGYLAEGHNYGVCTGIADLIVFDSDDLTRLDALGVTTQLPDTFKVQTGRGGQHAYLFCPGLKDRIILEDPELKDADSDPLHLGEIQTLGQQVVGPGSIHPNGNKYEVINDAPIAAISCDELLAIIAPLKVKTDTEDKAERGRQSKNRGSGSSLGDLIPIDLVCWPKDIKERAGSEVRGSHPLHKSESGKNFSVNTTKNSWHCFRHKSGGGPLEWLAVDAGLIKCEDAKPGCLDDKELFKQVLQIARDKGFDIPAPEKPKQTGPTVIDAIRALKSVCDGAVEKDECGFNGFDAKTQNDIIEKAVTEGTLSKSEEKTAHRFLKKYEKQLKGLGVVYKDIVPIERSGDDEEKESMATAIVKLVTESGAETWHTSKQDLYISFERNGHRESHPIRSKATRLWLGQLFYNVKQKTPSSQALNDASTIIEGAALYGPEIEAYVRVAPHEDRIYVDIGDDSWRAIEITKDGWKIVNDVPVRFWRPKSMLPLPEPQNGGNWDDLRKLINAKSRRNWILVVSWAIQAYWPTGPYAHHNFAGEQGTGKTLAQIIFKLLLDPSVTPLRRPPKDERDLMIAARNERIPSFDNLSGMPEQLSDAFCGLSTGVALASRALYTDSEESFLSARRPCMMNGIDTLSNRGDLLDRTIINELPRISPEARIREKRIMADFERIRPQLLGLFLDATSTGLSRLEEIDDTGLPRMADFCAWVMACEPALPWDKGEFMEEYQAAIDSAQATLVEGDQVARAVYDLALGLCLAKKNDQTEEALFSGTSSDLLDALNLLKYIDPNRPPKGWPRLPNHLSSRLRRLAPALRALGVQIDFSRANKARTIEISMSKVTMSDDEKNSSSPKNLIAETLGDDGDDDDDKNTPSSVEPKMKKEERKKERESRREGKKTVIVVTPSPSDQRIAISEVTMKDKSSSPIVTTGPDLPKLEAKSEPEEPTQSRIRGAAIVEYGQNGQVDPRKLALALKIPEDQITIELSKLGYTPEERPGGRIMFKQRVTDPVGAGR